MLKSKKVKILLFFLISYVILVPIINWFMQVLEKCFQMNLDTIDINIFNLFTVIFKNWTIGIIWLIVNIVIMLVIKNILITKQNSKIEVEGINLKKKDRNIWNSRLGKQRRN